MTKYVPKNSIFHSISTSNFAGYDAYFNIFIDDEKVMTEDINFKSIKFILPAILSNQFLKKDTKIDITILINDVTIEEQIILWLYDTSSP